MHTTSLTMHTSQKARNLRRHLKALYRQAVAPLDLTDRWQARQPVPVSPRTRARASKTLVRRPLCQRASKVTLRHHNRQAHNLMAIRCCHYVLRQRRLANRI